MVKKLLFFRTVIAVLLLACLGDTAAAQTSVQIGTGTTHPTYTGYGPFYVYSSSSTNKVCRSNMLYSAAELAAAGIPNGVSITKIAFYKTSNAEVTGGTAQLRFYMQNSTTAPPLATTTTWASILGAYQQVYENTAQAFAASTGWLEFTLSTPFLYTGGSLEIACDWNYNGNSATGNFDWQYTSGYETSIVGQVSTTTSPATLSGTTTAYKNRPNIMITYTGGTPCSGTPVAGTAISSVSGPVCAGEQVLLDLTGQTTGMGITYEWESSPDNTFASVTSLGAPSMSQMMPVYPGATQWYRCKVVCNGGTPDYSAPVQVSVHSLFPSGTYTINNNQPTGGGNYNSFTDAVNAIKCGIDGGVTFNVTAGSGPYNEQVVIPYIYGTSATTPVIFNGNNATLSFTSTSTNERAILKLDDADYIRINNLNIVAGGTTTSQYGFGIHLMNNADNNIISGCTVTMINSLTSSNYAGIVIGGSLTSATATGNTLCDSNLITGNTIDGGYLGVSIVGNGSTSELYGNKVVNNVIKDFYTYGIYLNGNVDLLVEGNEISRPVRSTTTTFYGIYFTSATRGVRVNANRIHSTFNGNPTSTSAAYGINSSSADGQAGQENIVSNNLIYNFNGNGTENGIINTGSDYFRYYHNVIVLDNLAATAGATRGLYQTTEAVGIEFKNNIVYLRRGGSGAKELIYLNTASSGVTSNHNVFYLDATGGTSNFGYFTQAMSTFADWQNGTSQDLASHYVNPNFTDPTLGNFTPTANIDNLGTPVGVPEDINGLARSTTTPDIGAYEFSISGCSPGSIVPGTAEANVTGVICPNTLVVLSLTGHVPGAGQTYVWQSSATSGSGFSDISSPDPLTTFSISPASTMYYRAAVTCGGNTVYSTEVQVLVNPGLSGPYTINNGQATGGTNFNSFTDAVNAVSCGVTGDVTFTVAPGSGPYEEQITIPAIPGASSTFTVTFLGNGATLHYRPTASASRELLRLDGAKHIIIDSLHIKADAGSTYGWGVHLTNGADSNVIRKSIIDISEVTSTTQSNSGCVIVSGSNTSVTTDGSASYNLIDRNELIGAYQGIIITGVTNSLNAVGNIISNNVIRDFYTNGIEMTENDGTLIVNNNIHRTNRTAVSTFAGVELGGGCKNVRIEANRIHDTHNGASSQTGSAYGVYSTACDAPAGSENIVVNNLIYNFNAATGTQYALYNSGSDGIFYYHNTIVLDNAASTAGVTRGLYQTTSASGIEFKNNIVYIARGGSGVKTAIYKGTAGSTIVANNNVYYLGNAGTGAEHIGYQGAVQTSLASWQTVSGQDADSKAEDPMFTDPALADFTPGNALIDGTGLPLNVMTDILGAPRSATAPDPGAYEFSVNACNIYPLVAGTASGPANACPSEVFTLTLSGFTVASGITIQWEESQPGQGSWQAIPGATGSTYTVNNFSASMDYQARVTCIFGGNDDVSNVIFVDLNPFTGCYCIPASTSVGTPITNVTIRGTTLNNTTGALPAPFYEQYPAAGNTTASLVQGGTYFLDLTLGGMGISSFWIDYDHNGIYDTYEWTQVGTIGTKNTAMFTVPLTATPGLTGMRIRTRTTGANDADDGCLSMTLGETEDYLITIVPVQPCSGLPEGGKVTVADYTLCSPANVSLQLSGHTQESNIFYAWEYNDNGTWIPIPGATDVAYVLSGTSVTQEYRAAVSCGAGNIAYSDTVTVSIADPQLLSTTPGTRCGTGTVDLAATAAPGSTLMWYTVPTGGQPIGSGNVFTTPVIGTTTDFYVSATSGGTTQISSSGIPTSGTTTTNYGIYLEFLQDAIINSVDVFSSNAGTITVELRDNTGNTIGGPDNFTLVASDFSTPQTLALGYTVPKGDGYRLLATSHPGGLGYHSTASFPIPLGNGIGNVLRGATSTATSTTHYFFYNVNTTAGCMTSRVPVTATVTPSTPVSVSPDDTICMGSSITISASSSNPDYVYTWTPGGAGSSVTVSPLVTTEYYLHAVDGACAAMDTVVVTVKSADPVTATIAKPAEICVSGNVSLIVDPEPLFGIDYQWQMDDGNGFTDISGATNPSHVQTMNTETIYRLNMFCDGALVAASTPVTVTVNDPDIVDIFPGARCDIGSVALAVTTNDHATGVNWYTTAAGGMAVGSGKVFVTPSLASTTTYYAAANGGYNIDYYTFGFMVPERNWMTSTTDWGIRFETHTDCIIDSVGVYPEGSGTISILIFDQNNTQIYAGPVTNISGTGYTGQKVMVPVGAQLPPGNYKMGKLATGITNMGSHEISSALGYPFTHPVLTLTSGSQGGANATQNVYYFFYDWRVSVVSGCEGARVPVTATIHAQGTAHLARGGTVTADNQGDNTTISYTDPCNDLVAVIQDDPDGIAPGITTATVVTTGTVQAYNGSPYVPRIYDIATTNNGPATVTLYVLQSEFDAYNSWLASNASALPQLPTSLSDLANASNILITQYHSHANDAYTGPSGFYDASTAQLISSNIIATPNVTGGYWEIKFPVSGFSGFFIHSGSGPLMIQLRSIHAVNVGARNRVNWSSLTELDGDMYQLERSTDRGVTFNPIASRIPGQGNASSYVYWDENPVSGINYYRLKLYNSAGAFRYSQVVSAVVGGADAFSLHAFPNPVKTTLGIDIRGTISTNAYIEIMDGTGKLIRRIDVDQANMEINMEHIASGIYLLKYTDDVRTQTMRINKQ